MAVNKDFLVKNGIQVGDNAVVTGSLTAAGLAYPVSDGSNRQAIVTDGAGSLDFADVDTVESAVTNQTGSLIPKGAPVYQTGVAGNNLTIALSDASNAATMPAIGVAASDIANGASGYVIHFGPINGIDTTSFSEGDRIYVAPGGGFQAGRPSGEGNVVQFLGVVTKIHASNGGGIVFGGGRSMDVPNLDEGNIFIGQAGDTATTATLDTDLVPEGSNLYYTDTRAVDAVEAHPHLTIDGGTLYVDTDNNYVGIGDTSPQQKLDVAGNAQVQGNIIVTGTVDGVDVASFKTAYDNLTTDGVGEGTSNLYFTDARAQAAISTDSTLSYSAGQVSMPNSGVTAGSYGSASQVPVITVDAQGRVTSASTTAVAGVSSTAYDTSTGVLTINTSDGGSFTEDLGVGTADSPSFARLGVGGAPYADSAFGITSGDVSLEFSIDSAVADTARIFAYDRATNNYRDLLLRGNSVILMNEGTNRLTTTTTGVTIGGNIVVSGTVDGRDVAADGTKLDGIESGADVTDTANVTAAGALMDSEVTNLAQVKAFDSLDYATAAQGTLAASAVQPGDNVSDLVNDANYATTSYVDTAESDAVSTANSYTDTAVANLVDSSPATLDTLNELAAALGDDPNFATTVSTQIGTKLDASHDMTLTLAGDASGSATFTNMGNATLTVAVADDSHNHTIANVDGLQTALDGKVDDSQVLTNVPAGAVFTDTVYTHPTYAGDDFSIDTGALTGATVISDIDINVTTDGLGHVTDANASVATRTLTLANLGYTGATNANYYTHPSYAGDDINLDTGALSGATVISDLDFNVTTDTLGHVTDANATYSTRNLTAADIGAQPAGNYEIATKQTSTNINNSGTAMTSLSDGWYKWGSTPPTDAPFSYGTMLQLSDTNQKIQLAFGGSQYGKIAVRRADSGTFYDWANFWSEDNDGSGSGLDADLLDGLQASQFLRSDVADTYSSQLTMDYGGATIPLILKTTSTSGTGMYLDNRGRSGGKMFGLLSGNTGAGDFNIKDESAALNRLIIKSDGNTLLGTTYNSDQALRILHGATGRGWGIKLDDDATNTTYQYIEFLAGGSYTTAGTTRGSIVGTSSGVTYNTTSDRRLKDNIVTITDGKEKLLAMNPVTHTWIADPDAPAVHGFIAQEMQEVVPEAVTGEADGEDMMSMDYGRITPVIVAALQDALKEIEELKTRISQLEAK